LGGKDTGSWGLFQQVNELTNGQVGIAQQLAWQPWLDGFVVRYSEWKMIGVGFVPEANVTSSLPNDLIANTLEGLNSLAA